MRIGAGVKAVLMQANRPISSIGTRQAVWRAAFGALLRHAGNWSPTYFGPWAVRCRNFGSRRSVGSFSDGRYVVGDVTNSLPVSSGMSVFGSNNLVRSSSNTSRGLGSRTEFGRRSFATEAETAAYEQSIVEKLKQNFPDATDVVVKDQSGGCGSAFLIELTSEQFRGKMPVAQHRLVSKALKDEIASWHAVTIRPSVPS